MRINQYVALASGLSRRAADRAIESGDITINAQPAKLGAHFQEGDIIKLRGQLLILPSVTTTILLNKPSGYVCSRDGQGSHTVYDLLPEDLRALKTVGRLDKDSKGLLLLTNDGQLANKLTHPSFRKVKIYQIMLNRSLDKEDRAQIEKGIDLADGKSTLQLRKLGSDKLWEVSMCEGRNRQIRRTFSVVGYDLTELKRLKFGDYDLGDLAEGKYQILG